ncbi:MAG: low molecular weight protein-tyrosine-phosphatase [Leptospirales bacterium]
MIRVLFVCLGNICRSPLAQGIFEKKVKDENWDDLIHIDSAGTSGWHIGEKPHSGSIQVARNNSITIEGQKARAVHRSDQSEFDYFIAMDRENEISLITEFGIDKSKIFTLRTFDVDSSGSDVPDPYGGEIDGFNNVFSIINHSMDHFLDYLRQNHTILP